MDNLPQKFFLAVKAFIVHEGKVLIIRESSDPERINPGEYNVVGGRVEIGEHFADALHREVKEEVGLDITIGQPFFVTEWRPTVGGELWQVIGIYFACTTESRQVRLEDMYDRAEWIDPAAYRDYPIISNVVPVFEAYVRNHADSPRN